MQKLFTLIASVSTLAILSIGFSSCKDDEEEPAKATISFSATSKTVSEGETDVTANLVLDKPAPEDFILEYELTGSAIRKVGSSLSGDYEVVGGVGEVEIAKGESTAAIRFNILTDNALEPEEKIIIGLVDASSSQITIGSDDEMEIVIGASSVTASFETDGITVNEDERVVHSIKVNLGQTASSDIVVQYELSPWLEDGSIKAGAAIDTVRATAEELEGYYWDYFIDGTSGELTIPAGESSGTIDFYVYNDFLFEDNETFEVTLKNANGVIPEGKTKFTVTINQEDGTVVALVWPAPAEGKSADMDMILWFESPEQDTVLYDFAVETSTGDANGAVELLFIPNSIGDEIAEALGSDQVKFMASYVYRTGNYDPLNFRARFAEYIGGELEPNTSWIDKNGTYTLANLNDWTESELEFPWQIEQTFVYKNGAITDISEIDEPAAGSRKRSVTVKRELPARKQLGNTKRNLN